jgi:ABC-2 type transport system permease protein
MKPSALFWKNPVLVKEIRTRMRGNRAFVLISAHLLVIGGIILVTYMLYTASLNDYNRLEERRMLSKVLFGLLVSLEMVMISFTAPALTSGTISAEREHQTFELLQVTLLKPTTLVSGKYISSLFFILLLLFTAIPLQSPAFLVGGVLPQEIIIGTLILVVSAVTFCAVGIFFSSLFKRTLASTVASYAFAIFMVFGLPLLGVLFLALFSSFLSQIFSNFSLLTKSLAILTAWLLASITPAATIIATESFLLSQNSIWFLRVDIPYTNPTTQIFLPSPWMLYVIFYSLFSLILLVASVLLVRRTDT